MVFRQLVAERAQQVGEITLATLSMALVRFRNVRVTKLAATNRNGPCLARIHLLQSVASFPSRVGTRVDLLCDSSSPHLSPEHFIPPIAPM